MKYSKTFCLLTFIELVFTAWGQTKNDRLLLGKLNAQQELKSALNEIYICRLF